LVLPDDEKKLNATYIISVARKLGCSVFLLPEDIIEVRAKWSTFISDCCKSFSFLKADDGC
jgi:hypothetical protein